ncbi:MAG: AAA family ATPase, partial [Gammaproteobacteria bacterium]|nr:AAA family ATPase [Gammaproteobacteria bacterium]
MNTYTQWLNLDFDPFAPSTTSRDFYCSGNRQDLLDQIVEFSLYSNAMIAVTGPLGAGKTTLATNFCGRFADEAVCVKIVATLFMNQNQFLETLQDALEFTPADNSDTTASIEQICRYAAELDLEARSLILIIDDAHELSAEVLQLLTKLLEMCVDSSIHALLFGENQLDSLLQSTLTEAAQERLAVFPLDGFASEETQEYIRFKLATARYTKELPIDGGIVGAIHNSSQGMPGVINRLVVDALNAAAPASETDEFLGVAPVTSGNVIEQIEEYEGIEALEGSDRNQSARGAPEQAWIASIQPRYWAVAATLVVLLTGTLLFWDTSPGESESIPISVAVIPRITQAIEVESVTELTAALPTQTAVDEVVVSEAAELAASEAVDLDESAAATSATATTEEKTVAVEAVAAVSSIVEINDPELAVSTEVLDSIVEVAVVQEAAVAVVKEIAVITATSTFVEQLLQASPGNYAVQLLASHSEANINEFVAQLGGDHPAGY